MCKYNYLKKNCLRIIYIFQRYGLVVMVTQMFIGQNAVRLSMVIILYTTGLQKITSTTDCVCLEKVFETEQECLIPIEHEFIT